MIYKKFKDISLSRLGMGNMRLPMVDPSDPHSKIDFVKAHEIIDYAYNNGINYFDTAYVYNGGESEKCLGECMKKYPRDSFYLATKFNIMANPDYKAVFEEQLERLQTDYIDFYLLHCLMDSNYDQYVNSGAIEYFLKLKEEGKIKYLGFSSHASTQTLSKFADHHDWDFAQIQLNYYDWATRDTKEEYKILEERNIPIVVMEPVRGGRLADMTEKGNELLKSVHPDWSTAAWALNFVKSLPQVQVILSGMSTMDQIIDNVNTFSTADEFTEKEMNTVFDAADILNKYVAAPCTGCRYCCDDCPSKINIPEFLKVFNTYKIDGPFALKAANGVESDGKISDCIGCGACTNNCPQNLDVPAFMSEMMEEMKRFN